MEKNTEEQTEKRETNHFKLRATHTFTTHAHSHRKQREVRGEERRGKDGACQVIMFLG